MGGGLGGGGSGKRKAGGALLGWAATASGPGETSACGPSSPRGGTHLKQKKGPKSGFGGRIWRGVPVLTTYTPSARGLGGYLKETFRSTLSHIRF